MKIYNRKTCLCFWTIWLAHEVGAHELTFVGYFPCFRLNTRSYTFYWRAFIFARNTYFQVVFKFQFDLEWTLFWIELDCKCNFIYFELFSLKLILVIDKSHISFGYFLHDFSIQLKKLQLIEQYESTENGKIDENFLIKFMNC